MKIHHKGIQHENMSDAPFIGARILSVSCPFHCKGCCNKEYLRDVPVQIQSVQDIIQEVLANPFNEGIILGGLEWSNQAYEMVALAKEAQHRRLKVIIYTGYEEDTFRAMFEHLLGSGIYIKFGQYDYTKTSSTYNSMGVQLASTNQYIRQI